MSRMCKPCATNIASSDLYAIGNAFASHTVDAGHRFALTQVRTNDRNILENYEVTKNAYRFSEDYSPVAREYMTGAHVDLVGMTKEYMGLGSSLVYAKQLTKRTHVFTIWDPQKYIYGKPGD